MAPPPNQHHHPHPPALPTVAESRWEDELSPTTTSTNGAPISPLLQRGPHYSLQDKARAAAAASKAAVVTSAVSGAAEAQPNAAPYASSNTEGDFSFSVPSADPDGATSTPSASTSDPRTASASADGDSAGSNGGQRAPARPLRPLSIEYPSGTAPGAQKSPSNAEYTSSSAAIPRAMPRGRRAGTSPHGSGGNLGIAGITGIAGSTRAADGGDDVESLLSPGMLHSNHPNLYLPNPRPSPRLAAHPRLFPRGLTSHPSSSNLSSLDALRDWFSSTFARPAGGTPLSSPTANGTGDRGGGGGGGGGFGGKVSAHVWLLVLLIAAVGLVVGVMVCVWLVVLAKNGDGGNPEDYLIPLGPHSLRMNEIQVVGSRRSYHVAPEPEVFRWLRDNGMMSFARTTNFTHKPLQEQLSAGYRYIHLDVLYDPEGRRYSSPNVYQRIDPANNTQLNLNQPGYKVMRMQDVDFLSTCATLRDCLAAVKAFSDQHPRHLPITVNIDFGDGFPLLRKITELLTPPLPVTEQSLLDLELEILSVIPRSQIITPDEVRASHETLASAIATRTAWPALSASAGRFLFLLSDSRALPIYRQMSPSLEGRVLFTAQTAAGEGDIHNTPDQAVLIVETLDSFAADKIASGHLVVCPVAPMRSELAVFMWDQAVRSGCQIITVADLWNEQTEKPVGTGSDGTEGGLPRSRRGQEVPAPSSSSSSSAAWEFASVTAADQGSDSTNTGSPSQTVSSSSSSSSDSSSDGSVGLPGPGGAGLGGVDKEWEVQGLHGGPLLKLPLLVDGGEGVQAKCLKHLNKEECEKQQWVKLTEPVPEER
ncbi:unnamed protein product [Closterium sp. NIES-53]